MSETKPLELNPAATAQEMLADVPRPETPAAPVEPPAPPVAPDSATSAPEVDSLNRPFDAAKFRPEKDSLGRWKNLRGGRKPRAASQNPPADLPPAENAWSAADRADAANATPAAETETASAETPRASARAADAVDRADDAAEVVCRAVYTGAGVVFDAPEDCDPKPAEHENMRKAVAAYNRAKGWAFGAGVGLLLVFAAYLLRTLRKPGPSKNFRAWVSDVRASRAKPVQPETPAGGVQPAPGPVVTITPTFDGLSERSGV